MCIRDSSKGAEFRGRRAGHVPEGGRSSGVIEIESRARLDRAPGWGGRRAGHVREPAAKEVKAREGAPSPRARAAEQLTEALPLDLRVGEQPRAKVVHLPSGVISGHQRSSEVIRGQQTSSEVIRGHPSSSELISEPAHLARVGRRRPLSLPALDVLRGLVPHRGDDEPVGKGGAWRRGEHLHAISGASFHIEAMTNPLLAVHAGGISRWSDGYAP